MRILQPLLISLCFSVGVLSQGFDNADVQKEKHNYQSDVARLRKIVIDSLYSHKEIFLRELLSNANDALEKFRLTALTDKTVVDNGDPLNITIKAVKDEDGKGGKIIISDTGIGMSPEELSTNLGTLAKSGTSDFLKKAENDPSTANNGNLIGAFGLGFYSSFLVANKVYVASLPPASKKNPNPVQHVFSSSADDSEFEIFVDPRGNTLGRGTEITLILKDDDAKEYLDTEVLKNLVDKHSLFSSSFPVYLFTQKTEQVPDESEEPEASASSASESATPSAEADGEDQIIVEEEKKEEEPKPVKMKDVVVDKWEQLNAQAPIWTRDNKNVTDDEYVNFYKVFFKDQAAPLAWHHFSGDSGSGVSFKAILYLPSKLGEEYWQQPLTYRSKDIKLLVKRTFITNDLGESSLPKWASWIRVVVDADDLPLNVSRETLQSSNQFLRQLKSIIIKRILQVFARLSKEVDEEGNNKFEKEIYPAYGTVLKLGTVEDEKNRDKLIEFVRYTTNQRNFTSLDQYLENKKKGQKQIFYINELGKDPAQIAKSVFVEKLHARGYEVLLLNEPIDEIFVSNIRQYKGFKFQDIAKVGLKFGDEDLDDEAEKALEKELNEKFEPLMKYLKEEAQDVVRDVVISNRLVTSPCAIVADTHGYTANVERMMAANPNAKNKNNYLGEFLKKAKLLEINPKSPLIEGMLRRVEQLPSDEADKDPEAVAELKEVASILIDGALIRSGFEVPDTNEFFSRVDRVLRRSLGVSETAPTDATVKDAPPVDPEIPQEEEVVDSDKPGVQLPDAMKDNIKIEMEEIDEEGNVIHDEL